MFSPSICKFFVPFAQKDARFGLAPNATRNQGSAKILKSKILKSKILKRMKA
jgi:hypothetical protein